MVSSSWFIVHCIPIKSHGVIRGVLTNSRLLQLKWGRVDGKVYVLRVVRYSG